MRGEIAQWELYGIGRDKQAMPHLVRQRTRWL